MEARMYTLGAFFALLSAYFLIKALRSEQQYRQSAEKIKKTFFYWYLAFSLAAGASILTHYYLLFTISALCLYGLWFHFKTYGFKLTAARWLWASYILIALLFLPWLKIFLSQYRQVGQSYWIPPINFWSIPSTIWQILIGINNDISKTSTQLWVLAASVFSLVFLWQLLKKTHVFEKWLIFLALIAPFAGAILFYILSKATGGNSSVFLDRYFLFAAIFYSIALALWISNMRSKKAAAVIIILYAIINVFAVWDYWRSIEPEARPGMRGAAAYLSSNTTRNDKILISSSSQFFSFKYYNDTGVKPLFYYNDETDDIAKLPHFIGTALFENQDLAQHLETGAMRGDTVWVIWTDGFYGSKPRIPRNWTQIGEEQRFGDIVRPNIKINIYVDEYKVN
jgi:hypothetical protein